MGSVEIVVSTMRAEILRGRAGGDTAKKIPSSDGDDSAGVCDRDASLMDTEEGFERLGTALLEIDLTLRLSHGVRTKRRK